MRDIAQKGEGRASESSLSAETRQSIARAGGRSEREVRIAANEKSRIDEHWRFDNKLHELVKRGARSDPADGKLFDFTRAIHPLTIKPSSDLPR